MLFYAKKAYFLARVRMTTWFMFAYKLLSVMGYDTL